MHRGAGSSRPPTRRAGGSSAISTTAPSSGWQPSRCRSASRSRSCRTTSTDAAEILTTARLELTEALEELRELARGLHPNVLTDRGLGPALEALVMRSPIPVEIDVPGERFPPAIEAAAYYVSAEALANVAKYAGATGATVRVSEDDDGQAIVVEVADDGIGGADPARGSGLEGLEDRVESLDGEFDVESPSGGGTRVRATIPMASRLLPF